MSQPTSKPLALIKNETKSSEALELASNRGLRGKYLAAKIATLQSLFPNSPLIPEANVVYMDELDALFHEIGQERLESCIKACVRECKFMPTIAEIRNKAGLNPEMLAAIERDAGWWFAIGYREKWRRTGECVGVLEETGEEVFLDSPGLPARVAYALNQSGGWCAIEEAEGARDLSFVRKAFDEAWDRFPCSEEAKPDNLHPFVGKDKATMLKGTLTSGNDHRSKRKPIDPGAKVISAVEYRKAQMAKRTPEEVEAAEKFARELGRKFGLHPKGWEEKTVNQADPDGVPV